MKLISSFILGSIANDSGFKDFSQSSDRSTLIQNSCSLSDACGSIGKTKLRASLATR